MIRSLEVGWVGGREEGSRRELGGGERGRGQEEEEEGREGAAAEGRSGRGWDRGLMIGGEAPESRSVKLVLPVGGSHAATNYFCSVFSLCPSRGAPYPPMVTMYPPIGPNFT